MNVNPQSTLRLVRQLSDPTDTGTYYVQAVVRNSATGATIATVNLTDEGSQRFSGSTTTPPDGSGNGLYIDVTTTVYTDNGYTTKSTNYGIEANTYFVHQQWNHAAGLGGGLEVNYDKIRRLIKEELDAQEKQEIPEQRDLTPEMLGMERRIKDAVQQAVASIQFPAQVQPDLDRVIMNVNDKVEEAINTLLIAVDQKDVTPETDLMPVMQAIDNLPIPAIVEATQNLNQLVQTLQELVNTQQDVTEMKAAAEEFMKKVSPRTIKVPKENPQDAMALRARKLLGV